MTELLTFALVGLGMGAVYAGLGLGLVVTFKATGVINFAAAAMGAWGAYTYAELRSTGDLVLPVVFVPDRVHLTDRVAAAPAAAIATAAVVVLGLAIHLLVFRSLRGAPALAKVVASAGVMLAIQSLIALRFGVAERVAAPVLPRRSIAIGGIAVPEDRLWLAATAIGISVVTALWFRHSITGLAMRAAAENELFVALARFSAHRLAAVAWALSSAVVGVISVLAAPVVGLNAADNTLLIVPALACALAGRLTAVGWTVAAGLALGAVNSEITYLSGRSWWPSWAANGAGYALPLFGIVAMLALLGKSLPTREKLDGAGLPAVPRPRFKPGYAALMSAAGVVLLLVTADRIRFGVITSMIFAVMALSFVVLTGLLGQVSFAQAVLAGAAGFVLSRLAVSAGLGFPVAPLLAACAATGLGVLAGIPALRIRGAQLAVVTLAAAVAIEQLVFRNAGLVGVMNLVPAPHLLGLDLGVRSGTDTARLPFGLLCLAVLVLAAAGVGNLTRSATGRRFLAVRSNERASAAIGIDVARTKLLGIAFSSFLAGISGCLLGYSKGSLSAESFSTLLGVSLLLFAYLGGITSVGGALVAGTFAPLGIAFVVADGIVGTSSNGYQLFAAVALIATAVFNPEGIAGKTRQDLAALRRRLRAGPRHADTADAAAPALTPKSAAAAETPPPLPVRGESILSVEHLTVRYAGVTAVDDVSLTIRSGQIVGLIGANGAGKTSFIDALSGFTPCTGGIVLDGADLDAQPPHRRARSGLARTWQTMELFSDLTVRENLLLAAERPTPVSALADIVHPARGHADRTSDALLDLLGLRAVADAHPAALSLGRRKLVNVARALAAEPRMLLLDEPASGLSAADTRALGRVLRTLADQSIGILLVEHDIAWILEICDVVHVLDFGRVIAAGPPADIRTDTAVLSAYLGARVTGDSPPQREEHLR
ncbi:branched-chain amino acid ABC transporter permease/ATP-binding protein [Actinomadura montaniterrae]|uniref:ATP-binding cassette domain-containing protein n=1 Tax=Actinomadura montaniterrae TaxID=1803903 RepID=A0A6L3VY31_9ACTN|nr:branched-chain amino acid ABC transporter permease/ATP-binding protein [Actinomadura montaniterrae]KAB2378914.1 ATP-binding cassette domain-containing protein [Actinomadura montaniterrae]